MTDEPIRILIVEARFYDDLADALLEGATQALSAFGAEYDVVTIPLQLGMIPLRQIYILPFIFPPWWQKVW